MLKRYEDLVKDVKDKDLGRFKEVHEAASSFNVEEWEDIQARVEANEELVQRLQAEEREKYSEAGHARMLTELINQRKRIGDYTLQQLRGFYFNEIKTLFETTMRRANTFVLIESKVDRVVPELAAGSSKRAAEEELDQESSKRDDLVMLWSLVKEKFNLTELIDDKERKIWVELNRLFVPNTDDEEGNRHLLAGREGVSIVKGNSYIDDGRKALGGTR
ncbi:hypothetical protein Tco_0317821 [Tanacetum coccineum]